MKENPTPQNPEKNNIEQQNPFHDEAYARVEDLVLAGEYKLETWTDFAQAQINKIAAVEGEETIFEKDGTIKKTIPPNTIYSGSPYQFGFLTRILEASKIYEESQTEIDEDKRKIGMEVGKRDIITNISYIISQTLDLKKRIIDLSDPNIYEQYQILYLHADLVKRAIKTQRPFRVMSILDISSGAHFDDKTDIVPSEIVYTTSPHINDQVMIKLDADVRLDPQMIATSLKQEVGFRLNQIESNSSLINLERKLNQAPVVYPNAPTLEQSLKYDKDQLNELLPLYQDAMGQNSFMRAQALGTYMQKVYTRVGQGQYW